MVDGYRRPEHPNATIPMNKRIGITIGGTRYFTGFPLSKQTDRKMAESACRPEGKAGEQHHRVQIFLVLCTGLLATGRGRLPACRQKLDQSLVMAKPSDGCGRPMGTRASIGASASAATAFGLCDVVGGRVPGGPDRRCLTGLLPLDGPEHPDLGLRLRGLSGERRRTGILPRHGSGLPPVHIDHVADELQIVGIIDHYGCLVDYRVEGWRRKRQG